MTLSLPNDANAQKEVALGLMGSVEDRQVKQRMLDVQEKHVIQTIIELLRTSNMNAEFKEESKQNLLHFTRAVASIMSSDNQDLLTPMQDGLAAKVTKMSPSHFPLYGARIGVED